MARTNTTNEKETVVELKMEDVVEVTTAQKEKPVDVRLKIDAEFYYGDKWCYFKKGETYKVSPELKTYLAERDALDVL